MRYSAGVFMRLGMELYVALYWFLVHRATYMVDGNTYEGVVGSTTHNNNHSFLFNIFPGSKDSYSAQKYPFYKENIFCIYKKNHF